MQYYAVVLRNCGTVSFFPCLDQIVCNGGYALERLGLHIIANQIFKPISHGNEKCNCEAHNIDCIVYMSVL